MCIFSFSVFQFSLGGNRTVSRQFFHPAVDMTVDMCIRDVNQSGAGVSSLVITPGNEFYVDYFGKIYFTWTSSFLCCSIIIMCHLLVSIMFVFQYLCVFVSFVVYPFGEWTFYAQCVTFLWLDHHHRSCTRMSLNCRPL